MEYENSERRAVAAPHAIRWQLGCLHSIERYLEHRYQRWGEPANPAANVPCATTTTSDVSGGSDWYAAELHDASASNVSGGSDWYAAELHDAAASTSDNVGGEGVVDICRSLQRWARRRDCEHYSADRHARHR